MPLVLVGPILRRVTHSSVSVFIVTKQSRNVSLNVLDASNNIVLSGTANTKALGEHVHVLVITTDPASGALVPNQVYKYNLEFNGTKMIQSNGTLTDGILKNSSYALPEGIAYGNHIYPTFVLPADSLDELRFTHGSCRKPHGGVTDALRGLDTILSSTISNSSRTVATNERPQFLCLTGDQIYADDVADGLLHIIIDIEKHLFNWGSPDSRESLPTSPSADDLKPGSRQSLVALPNNRVGPDKFTSSGQYAKSHLIRLAEYYGMYLLVWSDVLWPANANDFPSFEQLSDNAPRTITYDDRFTNMVSIGGTTRPVGSPGTVTTNTNEYNEYLKEKESIVEYRRSLKYVRKSLANIPTYMMFDDHEITDDWFLTREWIQNVLNPNGLTKRIVQNGLVAFSVFQAWGNTPDRFSSGDGLSILNHLESLNSNGGGASSVFTSLGNLVLPNLNSSSTKLEGGFQWNFQIQYNLFELIILDTRTQRGYQSDDGPPALIHPTNIISQIDTSVDKNFAIIVSPAPVFGDVGVERVQRLYTNIVDFGNPYEKDFEAWVFHDPSFQDFLKRISDFPSCILLSGDVHYGFSSSIEYWKIVNGTRAGSGIAQLCASSLKNSDSGTESAATNKAVRPRLRNFTNWPNNYERVMMPEDIRYRIYFEVDERTHNQRLGSTPISVGSVNSQHRAGYNHYNTFSFDSHRYAVGRDNIGFVKVNNHNSLKHEFWFVMGRESRADNIILQPSTVHTVLFGQPRSIAPI